MALVQTARASLQTALNCGRFFVRAFATAAVSTEAAGPLRTQHQFLSAYSGFPKDLRYGPSVVRSKHGFGDDACFIARHRMADVVGVADGVGGWRTYGVDPSRFSRRLMQVCAQLVEQGRFRPHFPAELIAASYKRVREMQLNGSRHGAHLLAGSCTACIVMLDRHSGRIHTANLGDSGFLVIRNGQVVHRSHEQQHYFNAPFQLALPINPENTRFLSDSPESAETTSFEVVEGDLILVATDGLFDNMPTHLIESELAGLPLQQRSVAAVQATCNSLALQARQLAMDSNHMSPFAQKAVQHGITDAKGGKPDDITLILALVTRCGLERVEELDETDVQ